jgi:hypothetical protein
MPVEAVAIEGTASEYVRIADSGNRITYSFCPVCGSTVYYRSEDQPALVAVPIGAFADPSFPEPAVSCCEKRKHGWVRMPTNMTRER